MGRSSPPFSLKKQINDFGGVVSFVGTDLRRDINRTRKPANQYWQGFCINKMLHKFA
jgi:hypothetical protein